MHARTHKRFLISLFFLSKISFSAVLIGLIDHLKQIRLDYMGEDVGRGGSLAGLAYFGGFFHVSVSRFLLLIDGGFLLRLLL